MSRGLQHCTWCTLHSLDQCSQVISGSNIQFQGIDSCRMWWPRIALFTVFTILVIHFQESTTTDVTRSAHLSCITGGSPIVSFQGIFNTPCLILSVHFHIPVWKQHSILSPVDMSDLASTHRSGTGHRLSYVANSPRSSNTLSHHCRPSQPLLHISGQYILTR